MRKFIDIGANLLDGMYSGVYNGSKKHQPDLVNVLERSWAAGLEKMIITAGNASESVEALKLAESDDRLFSTVGCHPTRCLEFENCESPENYINQLRTVLKDGGDKIAAFGECGLDYDRIQFCPKDVQIKYLKMQLDLNKEFNKPLFLHCRNSADDLFEIVKEYNMTGVVHSFDGTIEEANKFLDLGFYIGLNGCSLKTEKNLETVKDLPIDKILIETDCPWCEIRPTHASYKYVSQDNLIKNAVKKEKWAINSMIKGRNEPCNIRQVCDIIASIKQVDSDVLSETIFQNTEQIGRAHV